MRNPAAAILVSLLTFIVPARADVASVIGSLLEADSPSNVCGSEGRAIYSTRARLVRAAIPSRGKVIVVNVPSQTLVAYLDGRPILESKVVVGAPTTRTPEMVTGLSFVRFNPTWTVPTSILGEAGMLDLAADPAELARQGFHKSGGTLVQAPGDDNALGLIKFGLTGGGTIYLHDTNAPEGFAESERDLSHGCVRVEDAFGLAAWVLGMSVASAHAAQERGDLTNHRGFGRVTVVLGYFTAWPDADGKNEYFQDIYSKDTAPPICGASNKE